MRMRLLTLAASALMLGPSLMAQTAKPAVSAAYAPFNVGEIKPTGWLKDWASRAARGMTKNIGIDFTEFVRGWGDADQGGWWHYEQTAYYTDGFVRLGFLLDDTLLINRSHKVMEAVMARQKDNGYIHSNNKDYVEKWGTLEADYGLYWSEGVFCRAALAYYQATGDERVLNMLKRVYANFPLFAYDTTKKDPFNGGDLDNMRKIVGVENMLEVSRLSGDPSFAERALQVLKNYEPAYIQNWAVDKKFLRTAICHGVSYNEAAKLPAAGYIWNGNADYLAASVNTYEFIQENTMLPIGSNSSNEYLHGIGAFEATESCDVSDFMWSNIWMARATGDSRYGDRIETDAFNALPGAVNPSFTQSVYTQAPNRIPGFHLRIRDDGAYYKEMHWPTCCPANLNRALPNYIINMAMLNGDGQLMWLTYGPAHLKTRDGQYDIECQTEYPFRDKLTFVVNAIPTGQVLRLRIPSWCDAPQAEVVAATPAKSKKKAPAYTIEQEDGFYLISGPWQPGDKVELTFPMKPTLVTGNEKFPFYKGEKAPSWGMMGGRNGGMELDGFIDQGRCAWVTYGPLVCAMSMQRGNRDSFDNNEELWTEYRYALTPRSLEGCTVDTTEMKYPFSWHYLTAPLTINATANLVDWNPDKGDAVMPMEEPATLQKDIPVKLVPYGCLAYRLTMFPLVDE